MSLPLEGQWLGLREADTISHLATSAFCLLLCNETSIYPRQSFLHYRAFAVSADKQGVPDILTH